MDRGVDRRDVFLDDLDRHHFLSILERRAVECSVDILAYCLMGNHFHFAVKVDAVPLSAFMQRVLTAYAIRFNLRHERTGHLFQARYKSKICLDDACLAQVVRYIHLNPVKAGLVARAEDWPWSSARRYPTDDQDYPVDFDPWRQEEVRLDLSRETEVSPISIDDLGARISTQTGVSVGSIRSNNRNRQMAHARRLLAREAILNGHSLTSVARWLGMSVMNVSRYANGKTLKR